VRQGGVGRSPTTVSESQPRPWRHTRQAGFAENLILHTRKHIEHSHTKGEPHPFQLPKPDPIDTDFARKSRAPVAESSHRTRPRWRVRFPDFSPVAAVGVALSGTPTPPAQARLRLECPDVGVFAPSSAHMPCSLLLPHAVSAPGGGKLWDAGDTVGDVDATGRSPLATWCPSSGCHLLLLEKQQRVCA
jgi:hypothetical protein